VLLLMSSKRCFLKKILVLFETDGHFQKCMSKSDCEMQKQNAYINIKCCQKDFCNTFD